VSKRDISNADRFRQIARATAKRLDLRSGDPVVEHIATLMLAREHLSARLIAGDHVDPDKLLKLDAAIMSHMPAVHQEPVELVVVRSMICPECRDKRPMTEAEQSQQSSPAPTLGAAHRENTPNAQASVSVAPRGKSKPTVEPPLHERLAKDSRPNAPAPVNGAGSLVWFGTNNGGGPR
jgi:hypothetical protein